MTLADLLLVQLVASSGMAAVIWFVQIAHYPLHALVPEGSFFVYHAAHLYRVSFIVGPLMLVETAAASWILFMPLTHALATLAWVGFGLILMLWLSTALLQVPCHRRLEHGYDLQALRRLVATNWIRTVLWTGRVLIAVMMCAEIWQSAHELQGQVR